MATCVFLLMVNLGILVLSLYGLMSRAVNVKRANLTHIVFIIHTMKLIKGSSHSIRIAACGHLQLYEAGPEANVHIWTETSCTSCREWKQRETKKSMD